VLHRCDDVVGVVLPLGLGAENSRPCESAGQKLTGCDIADRKEKRGYYIYGVDITPVTLSSKPSEAILISVLREFTYFVSIWNQDERNHPPPTIVG